MGFWPTFHWNMYECSPGSVLNEVLAMSPAEPRVQTVHVVGVPNWYDLDWVTLKRSPHILITVERHSNMHLSLKGIRDIGFDVNWPRLKEKRVKSYVHGGTESYFHPSFWRRLMSELGRPS